MSFPRRILAMYFKSEDFPASVPPRRRMVYDSSALFFGVLTIPCLRNFTSLGNTIRTDASKVLLKLLNSQAVTGVGSGVGGARRIADRLVRRDFVTGRTATDSVVTHDFEFRGKTRGPDSTSTVVDIAGVML
jgi:hypothetical protein